MEGLDASLFPKTTFSVKADLEMQAKATEDATKLNLK